MHAHAGRLLTFGLMCGIVFWGPKFALTQTAMPSGFDPRDIVRATPFGTELEVQIDNHMRLRGRLLSTSQTMLRLSLKNEIAELHRDHLLKVYQLSPKPEELRRMTRNLATITGVAVGMEIAKDKRAGYFLVPALGGAFGAYAGYAIGNRMKTRLLIYDASPRTLADSQNSKLTSRAAQRPRKVVGEQ